MRSNDSQDRRTSLKLSKLQREILVGILLGDACLETRNSGRTFRLKVEQSVAHERYLVHLHEQFRCWTLSPPHSVRRVRRGVVTESLSFSTVSHSAFRFYGHQFYIDGKKRVPELIHRWLTPRGLAYWLMDDGSIKSRQSKGVIINTHGFCPSDVERLVSVLSGAFGMQCSCRRQRDGIQIYISGSSYERVIALVEPFFIPDMRYKLPHARRTHMPKE